MDDAAAASVELPRYKSHKNVWALEISGVTGCTLTFVEKGYAPITVDPALFIRYTPVAGDFLVQYEDGYKSISPRKAFVDGYTPEKATAHAGLPVAGYKPQSESNVALVNANKGMEESVLRVMDALKADHHVDQRWLAVARTHIEEGFMALNRSIFRPGRVALPGDADQA